MTQPVESRRTALDAAEACVLKWPGTARRNSWPNQSWPGNSYGDGQRTSRGTVTVHASEIGEAQGASDPTRSGGRLLETLLDAGLIEVIGREGGEWTIFMNDPTRRRTPFDESIRTPRPNCSWNRRQRHFQRRETVFLYWKMNQYLSPASTPLPTPIRRSRRAMTIRHTLRTHWTVSPNYGCPPARHGPPGRRRSRERDIKPMVKATLAAGIPAAEIADAMRKRSNVLEFYDKFPSRGS